MRRFDLEERLIDFSVIGVKLTESIPKNMVGVHLSKQLVRSCTSVSLNYGEALGAESMRDFIHKMKIVLKELRETNICLRLIERLELANEKRDLSMLIDESRQLIAIFTKSVETAKKRSVSN